jgi:hypothetical protein
LLNNHKDAMWGKHYSRRARAHKTGEAEGRTEHADEEESG